MNGSPLFTGDAGSGESEIRRWILENDWLEAIIALPEQLFYNTGIATYVWILTNRKPEARVDQVQLIDASDLWEPRRKSLGDKRRDISPQHRAQIVELYRTGGSAHAGEDEEGRERVKTFDRRAFGFRKIRVERPLRLNFEITPERIARLDEQRAFAKLAKSRKRKPEAKAAAIAAGREKQAAIKALLAELPQERYTDQAAFLKDLRQTAKAAGVKLLKPLRMAIRDALGERDPQAAICRDSQGRPEPDTDLRDYERVPLTETVEDYVAREIVPHVPDAWVDPDYADEHDGQPGRVGYEINFNRYFYTYTPPRPLAEIETDLQAAQARIADLMEEIIT
jgi:type I restriction enzyme M protein